jgi:hypothetical protein
MEGVWWRPRVIKVIATLAYRDLLALPVTITLYSHLISKYEYSFALEAAKSLVAKDNSVLLMGLIKLQLLRGTLFTISQTSFNAL